MTGKVATAAAGLLVAASVGAYAAMAPAGFADYEPPASLDIQLYDYMHPNGNPSTNPNDEPTWQHDYPYRAYFHGAEETTNSFSEQGYDTRFYVVLSKSPALEAFTFTYSASRGNHYGYIHAVPTVPIDIGDDVRVLYFTGQGVTPEELTVQMRGLPNDFGGFYFDFFYAGDSDFEPEGVRTIPGVHYDYILTGGGGSEGGNQSSGGGSSSGGNSSGGGSSGGSLPSEYNPYESSGPGIWESEGNYPWEDEDAPDTSWSPEVPPYVPDGEGDTGEQGDTWTLPDWNPIAPPFSDEDITIPDMPGEYEQSTPDMPGNFAEGYPEPVYPGGTWPPPMPPPMDLD
jgi:hypothetical protein